MFSCFIFGNLDSNSNYVSFYNYKLYKTNCIYDFFLKIIKYI